MGFFLGGALVSSAPTAQKCTIYLVGAAETAAPPGRHQPSRNASFTLLVQQRLLHPLEVHQPSRNALTEQNCTIYFVEGVSKLKYLAN